MSERTPRPWPENTQPTPEQLAAWLGVATEEERIDHASRCLDNAEAASGCFIANHEGLKAEVEHLREWVALTSARDWNATAERALLDSARRATAPLTAEQPSADHRDGSGAGGGAEGEGAA